MGALVGALVGAMVGALVGVEVGASVGTVVGACVGDVVGAGVSHLPVVQLLLWQSEFCTHDNPSAQGGQSPPPQSSSVSFSPFSPSLHDIAVGALVGEVVGATVGTGVGARVPHTRSVFTVGAMISY